MTAPADGAALRIGVLGASSIAWRRTLPALLEVPQATVTAVASRDPDRATRLTRAFGGTAVPGYQALLEREDVDAVYVSVPNELHHRWAGLALRHGKHVLAEKPLTTSAGDTADLIRTAERYGLVLRENITFVHHGLHRTVADLVRRGRIGEPRHLDAAFCFPPLPPTDVRYRAELGGGALLDAGVYPVRLAQFLLGDDLAVVGSALRSDPAHGVDVAGSALLVAGTGQTVTATFGFEHGYGAGYRVWGSTGRLSVDRAFTPPATAAPVLRIEEQDRTEELVLPAEHQFARSVADFAAAALHAGRTGADPGHASWAATTLRTAELLERIGSGAYRIRVGKGS